MCNGEPTSESLVGWPDRETSGITCTYVEWRRQDPCLVLVAEGAAGNGRLHSVLNGCNADVQ